MFRAMDLGLAQGQESRAILDADLTAASLLTPLVSPKEHPLDGELVFPAAVASTMQAWAERPSLWNCAEYAPVPASD